MKKVSKETGIEIDDELKEDLGIASKKDKESGLNLEDKKIESAVKRARLELKSLLNENITTNKNIDTGSNKRKKSFVVVAK